VCCAKMAQPIEMQSGMLSWVGWVQRTRITWECRCSMGRGTLGVSGRLKSIVKQRILGLSKKDELCKEMGGPVLMSCMPYDVFLRKKLLL